MILFNVNIPLCKTNNTGGLNILLKIFACQEKFSVLCRKIWDLSAFIFCVYVYACFLVYSWTLFFKRLNQLKVSGEENWKKRASREKIAEMGMPTFNQKKEKQDLPIVQPATIASRLSQLEASSETWRERIEETDAKQFAVASKISKVASGKITADKKSV